MVYRYSPGTIATYQTVIYIDQTSFNTDGYSILNALFYFGQKQLYSPTCNLVHRKLTNLRILCIWFQIMQLKPQKFKISQCRRENDVQRHYNLVPMTRNQHIYLLRPFGVQYSYDSGHLHIRLQHCYNLPQYNQQIQRIVQFTATVQCNYRPVPPLPNVAPFRSEPPLASLASFCSEPPLRNLTLFNSELLVPL